MTRRRQVVAAGLLAGTALAVSAQAPKAESRGALLYGNHCIECHDTQMHWRDRRLVTDWNSLRREVRRWQAAAQLNWSDEDIEEVARHLDETIYHLPGGSRVAAGPRPPRAR